MQRRPKPRSPKTGPPSPANPFIGHWRITEMELWDREALDLLAPAFIRFEDDRMGGFQFIAMRGGLDCRLTERGGLPAVEFSWEGYDEGDARSGRGWAILCEGMLEGRFFIHGGDESWFIVRSRGRTLRPPDRRQRDRAPRPPSLVASSTEATRVVLIVAHQSRPWRSGSARRSQTASPPPSRFAPRWENSPGEPRPLGTSGRM